MKILSLIMSTRKRQGRAENDKMRNSLVYHDVVKVELMNGLMIQALDQCLRM